MTEPTWLRSDTIRVATVVTPNCAQQDGLRLADSRTRVYIGIHVCEGVWTRELSFFAACSVSDKAKPNLPVF